MNGFGATVGALIDANGGTSNVIGNSSTANNSVLTYAGNIGSPSNFDGTIQDVLGTGTKTVGLTVTSGMLTLSSSNTYTGVTTVNGGTLAILQLDFDQE